MPRINATFTLKKFESKTYTQALKKQVENKMKQAARAFVRAAVSHIPVETGMAAGSFLNIGRALKNIGLGDQTVLTYIRSQQTGAGEYKSKYGGSSNQWYYGKPGSAGHPIPKNELTASSYNLTTPVDEIIKTEGNKTSFTFQSRVFYLTLNDLFGSKGTGPWGAFEAGQQAFLAEMKNLEIPKVVDYITETVISTGTRSGLKHAPRVRIRKQVSNG